MAIWRPPPRAQQPKKPVYIPPILGIGDGLISFWSLNESTGNPRVDSVGISDLSEQGGTVTRLVPGKVGDAATFVQTNYLKIADNAPLSVTGSFSIWAWVRRSSSLTNFNPGIIGKWAHTDQRSYTLRYDLTADRFNFTVSSDGTGGANAANIQHSLAPSAGTWYFLQAYVDLDGDVMGFRIGTVSSIGSWETTPYTFAGVFNGTADFEVGRLGTSGDVFYGDIDAAGLSSRRLSDTNWNLLWNNGNGLELITPVAKAGYDQTRMELETVFLDGSQSFGDGLIYSWSQLSGTSVSLNNPTTPNPSFTAPDVSTPETLVFELTVVETDLDEASDQVSIRIVPTGSNEWLWYTPAEAGVDPDTFYPTFDSIPSPSMIARFDRVIGAKGDITLVGPTWSASKGLSALIAARQIQLGNIDYDDLIPDSDVPTSPEATLFQFLNMTSDYDLSPHAPGTHFAYNNASVHYYISHLKDTFYSGVSSVQMYQNAYLTALSPEDNQSFAGFYSGWDEGLSMSTRDALRVARLIQQRGIWNGVRILAESFMTGLWQQQIPDSATQSTDESDEFTNQSSTSDVMKDDWSLGHWYLTPDGIQVVTREYLAMYGKFGTSICISRETGIIGASVNVGGAVNDDALTRIQAVHFCAIIDATEESLGVSILAQLLGGD